MSWDHFLENWYLIIFVFAISAVAHREISILMKRMNAAEDKIDDLREEHDELQKDHDDLDWSLFKKKNVHDALGNYYGRGSIYDDDDDANDDKEDKPLKGDGL